MAINIEELTSRKTGEEFPNVLVLQPNDTLPVVVRSLEKGDMQLVVEWNGVRKVVARISPSALNIEKLIRTVPGVELVPRPNESIRIETIEDYLLAVPMVWT